MYRRKVTPRLTRVSRAKEKKIFNTDNLPTNNQLKTIWEQNQKLKMLQKYILSLNLENPHNHNNFLRAMELHNKTAGSYEKSGIKQLIDANIVYVTKEENDRDWFEKIRDQQKNLKMPTQVHKPVVEKVDVVTDA